MVVGNIRIIRVYCVYQVEKTNRQQKGQGVELFFYFCDGHTRLSCVYSECVYRIIFSMVITVNKKAVNM